MRAARWEDKKMINRIIGCSKITEIIRIDNSQVIFKNGDASWNIDLFRL